MIGEAFRENGVDRAPTVRGRGVASTSGEVRCALQGSCILQVIPAIGIDPEVYQDLIGIHPGAFDQIDVWRARVRSVPCQNRQRKHEQQQQSRS